MSNLITRRLLAVTVITILSALAAAPATTQPVAQGTWTMKGLAPLDRSEVAVVEMTGKIYVVGGEALGRED